MAARGLPGMNSPTTGNPFAVMRNGHPSWTGHVELIESKLTEPLHWRKPRTVFVNSMSDLWHEKLPLRDIASVYAVMRLAHWHTYQVLTKRPKVRLAAFNSSRFWELVEKAESDIWDKTHSHDPQEAEIPTPWIQEGVSVEDRKNKDRIDILRETPAAVRFLSLEPLLEDLCELNLEGIHWVIVGGESGPGARPMVTEWPRAIRDQCQAAGVPFFFKQWGEWAPTFNNDTSHGRMSGYLDVPVGDGTHRRMFRVGKRAAGRLLDGRTWDEKPVTLMSERVGRPQTLSPEAGVSYTQNILPPRKLLINRLNRGGCKL